MYPISGKKLPSALQTLNNFYVPIESTEENNILCRAVLNTSLSTMVSTSLFLNFSNKGYKIYRSFKSSASKIHSLLKFYKTFQTSHL